MTTAQQQVPLLSSSYDEEFNFKTTDKDNLIKHSLTTTSKPWWKILTVGGTQFDAFMMEGE